MLSRIACLFSIIFLLYTAFFFYPKWQKTATEATISWDVSGYYWYLPAIFIYKDLKEQSFTDSIIKKYQPTPEVFQSAMRDGKRVMTYSAGMAVMYLPAFAIAHALAEPLGYAADGFSPPYQFAVSMISLLAACIGVWQFRRFLLLYYSDTVTAIVLLCLVIGSNYLNYAAIDAALTHNWLFTIYVLLLLNTHFFFQKPNVKNAIGIGICCGLAILIRPSEIISILIPLLWGMENISKKQFSKQLNYLRLQARYIGLVSTLIILIGCIQLIYWKYASGHWLVYSYGDQGFSWLRPHTYDYTLSARSGWISYTPLALLFFIGIIPFVKYGRNKVAVLIFFALNLYIVSAWDIWWYGGTGGRAMIQSYPIIMLPFASLLTWLGKHKIGSLIAAPFILLFVYINIWFTANAHGKPGLYDPEGMSRSYYRAVLGRWNVSPETQKLKDAQNIYEGTLYNKILLYQNGFEDDTISTTNEAPIGGKRSIYLDGDHQYSTTYSFTYKEQPQWLRVQAVFGIGSKEWTAWRMAQMVVRIYIKGDKAAETILRSHRFLNDNEIKPLFMDVKLPTKHADSVVVLFWNAESTVPIRIDNLQVWGYDDGL